MISLSQTKYFRPKQLSILQRNGIRSITELLLYIPRKYIDRSQTLIFNKNCVGDTVTFIGQLQSREIKYGRRKRLSVKCRYQSYYIEVVFFQGVHYYQKIFTPGLLFAFSGKLDTFAGKLTMTHPEFEMLTEEDDALVHTGKIVPLYRITEGMRAAFITTKVLRKTVHDILADYSDKLQEYLQDSILEKLNLLRIGDALKKVHFPHRQEDVEEAKRRLAFDEVLVFAIIMYKKKQEREKIKKKYAISPETKKLNESKTMDRKADFFSAFSIDQRSRASYEYASEPGQKRKPIRCLIAGRCGKWQDLGCHCRSANLYGKWFSGSHYGTH